MLCGGKSWQTTGNDRTRHPKHSVWGMVTIGNYSNPLAVMILTRRVDRAGSQPMAAATFGGMIVVVAPVSSTIRTIVAPREPFSNG